LFCEVSELKGTLALKSTAWSVELVFLLDFLNVMLSLDSLRFTCLIQHGIDPSGLAGVRFEGLLWNCRGRAGMIPHVETMFPDRDVCSQFIESVATMPPTQC